MPTVPTRTPRCTSLHRSVLTQLLQLGFHDHLAGQQFVGFVVPGSVDSSVAALADHFVVVDLVDADAFTELLYRRLGLVTLADLFFYLITFLSRFLLL